MKKLFITLIMLVLAMSTFAYDFSAVCESGQTLYYRILSSDNHEVAVTFPNSPQIGWDDYPKPEGELLIPEFVVHESITYTVVSLDQNAFEHCEEITSIVFPNSIRRIGAEAFGYCTGLSGDLIIPDQCTSIELGAFHGCSNLSSLTIGSAVETIHRCAFADCTGLESIVCKTPALPFCESGDCRIFENVPTDIPVYVNCLTMDQFQMSQDWSQFTNMQDVFFGAPELTVGVNNPEFGTAEVVSIPEDCDQLTATVRAIPNPGHHFGYWKSGTIISFDEEYTFTLRHNTTLTAYFDCVAIINDELAFPDHITGRKINASGQVTEEYPSDFIYDEEGVLDRFTLPLVFSASFAFADYPTMPSSFTYNFGGYGSNVHPYSNHYSFTYDNNKIKRTVVTLELDATRVYYDYFYDDSWHMTKKTHQNYTYGEADLRECNTYTYENNYRTKIDSLFAGYETMLFYRRTENHYNERQQILASQVDNYNNQGDLTSRKLSTYSYTTNNKTDSIVTQTFTEGEWVNSDLTHYIYDDKNRVIEYQTGSWSVENEDWSITKRTIYDFHDEEQKLIVSFKKKNGDEWIWDSYSGQTLFYESELYEWQRAVSYYKRLPINQLEIDLHYVTKEIEFPWQSEWYYEIVWDDGSITYQHLECVGDTLFDRESRRPKVIVRSNTHYDRDTITEVTHEYIYEEGNKVYWWNKDLQEFTTLYDCNAEIGDEWEIKVGTESIIVHVDNVDVFEYQGETYKMLTISDEDSIFNGDIVVGFGHMTSFFPEKLMNRGKGFQVEGLRCYWVEDALLYHYGDEDCDAIHNELQDLEEDGPSTPSTGSGTAGTFAVYPNPNNGILFVETRLIASLPDQTYRITNLMGQTLLQGHITAETQQIDIANLPAGMYFISVGEQTMKFVVR